MFFSSINAAAAGNLRLTYSYIFFLSISASGTRLTIFVRAENPLGKNASDSVRAFASSAAEYVLSVTRKNSAVFSRRDTVIPQRIAFFSPSRARIRSKYSCTLLI